MVSVVIATHNRPEAVGRLLEAVASQNLGDLEVLVVDDGSERPAFNALEMTVADLERACPRSVGGA
jgi:cellulose synthase/poly-beta-1,6-N-acetylglucosamine synthase-like glycosyltransferase